MNSRIENILKIQPVTIKRECGGWLAVSPTVAIVRIGTTGRTEDEAISRFLLSAQVWADVLDSEKLSN